MSYSLSVNTPIRALIFNPSPVVDADIASNDVDALDQQDVNEMIGEIEYDEPYLVKVSGEMEDPQYGVMVAGGLEKLPACFPCLTWHGVRDGQVVLRVCELFNGVIGTYGDMLNGALGEYVRQFERRYKTTLSSVEFF